MSYNISQLNPTEEEIEEGKNTVKNRMLNFFYLIDKHLNSTFKNFSEEDLQTFKEKSIRFDSYIEDFKIKNETSDVLQFLKDFLINDILKYTDYKKIDRIGRLGSIEKVDDILNNDELFTETMKNYKHTLNSILAYIELYIKNDWDIQNHIKILNSEIDYTNSITFSSYQEKLYSENYKKINDINNKIEKLKDKVIKEYYENGILDGDEINGNIYIKYKVGDVDKVYNDERLSKLISERDELYEEIFLKRNWFDDFLKKRYDEYNNDFLLNLYMDRQNNLDKLYIPYIDFLKSRVEYEKILKEIDDLKERKIFIKEYRDKSNEYILNKILEQKNNGKAITKILGDYIYTDKDKQVLKEYIDVVENIKKQKKGVININRYIKRKIEEQPDIKKLYNKYKKLNNREKNLINFKKLINEVDELYSKYKNNLIIYKDINDPIYGDYNNIVLYNNKIEKLDIPIYYLMQYRCYEHSGGEVGFGGDEYCRGFEIVRNKEELIEKIQEKYNIKVFQGKWNKKYKQEGYKKLWIGKEEKVEGVDVEKLKIKICENCFKPDLYYFDKIENKLQSLYHKGEGIFKNVCNRCYREEQLRIQNEDQEENKKTDKVDKTDESVTAGKNDTSIGNQGDNDGDDDINVKGETNSAIIYKITNKENGKVYIGKTTQGVITRWYQHLSNPNSVFKDDLEKYGKTAFSFEILEEVNREEISYSKSNNYNFNSNILLNQREIANRDFEKYILLREQYYIDKYNSYKNGYNRRNNFNNAFIISSNNTKSLFD